MKPRLHRPLHHRHLLRSRSFHPKLFLGVAAAVAAVVGIAAGVLHWMFQADIIARKLNDAVAGTGRRVRFDPDISRSWFPRPTVTLHHFSLSNPQRTGTDLSAQNVKIGLSWQILFGRRRVEKMQWQGVDADVRIGADGRHNFADLLAKSAGRLRVNRILVDGMRLRLTDSSGNTQNWKDISGKIVQADGSARAFELQGTWLPAGYPSVGWHAKGTVTDNRLWQNVQIDADTVLPHLGKTTMQWLFDGTWTAPGTLAAAEVQWQWQSERGNLHASGVGKDAQISRLGFSVAQLNAVLTGTEQQRTLNATATANRLSWQRGRWLVDRFQIDSGWQDNTRQAALSVSGRFAAGASQWLLDNLTLTTHQDTVNRLPNPRFLAELTGRVSGSGTRLAHMQWQGSFDNRPVRFDADYRQENRRHLLSGSLDLDAFNLAPYLDDAAPSVWQVNPQWLDNWKRYLKNWTVQCQIRLGGLTAPLLTLNNISAQIVLDGEHFQAAPLHAVLYEGQSDGSLTVRNSPTLQWQVQQKFNSVQIKPLLQDSIGFHNLDGLGNAHFELHSEGLSSRDWLANLTGHAQLQVQNGSVRGIDINNILKNTANTQATLAYNEMSQTPFQNLLLNMPLEQGTSRQSTLALHAGNFDVSGLGWVNLAGRRINYDVLIDTRQNGSKSRNRLPVKMSGDLMRPSFTLDYHRLTAGLQTPEEKQKTLSLTLKKQWQWLNQNTASVPLKSAKP